MSEPMFDIERDKAIIEAGGFWCHACLVSHLAAEQSPDPRYCQGCYEFLLKEVDMPTGHMRKATWIPRKPKTADKKVSHVSQHGGGIMSTVGTKKSEVDTIDLVVRTKGKRGPKHKSLPEDLMEQLVDEGMGSKAIAAKLKDDFGIGVSYKTIQRRLSARESAT